MGKEEIENLPLRDFSPHLTHIAAVFDEKLKDS
jgi:hypothetical protein